MWITLQNFFQAYRTYGCDRHPLSIDRIKGANGISKSHKAFWQSFHPLKMAPAIFGPAIAINGRQRLSIFNSIIKDRVGQTFRKLEKGIFLRWWIIFIHPRQRDMPAVPFNRQENPSASLLLWTPLHSDTEPIALWIWQDSIVTAGIAEKGVDYGFCWSRIAQLLQPLGSMRRAATGIYDQVGMEFGGGLWINRAVAFPHPYSDDDCPVATCQQANHLLPFQQMQLLIAR